MGGGGGVQAPEGWVCICVPSAQLGAKVLDRVGGWVVGKAGGTLGGMQGRLAVVNCAV